jgi:CheY-like chemotaxis protein
MIDQQTVTEKLLALIAEVSDSDSKRAPHVIMNALTGMFSVAWSAYMTVQSDGRIVFSNTSTVSCDLSEDVIQAYMQKVPLDWNVTTAPFMGTVGEYAIVGIPFASKKWGLFLCHNVLPNTIIQLLMTFAKGVSSWCNETGESDKDLVWNSQKRHFDAMQSLYTITDWELNIASGACQMSNAFLGYFDQAVIKEAYTIDDLYHLMGADNEDLFKACIDKVISTQYKVFERFSCIQMDGKIQQNIHILFDPIIEQGEVVRIVGFCRDIGRSHTIVQWYESEFLMTMPVLPVEWRMEGDKITSIHGSSHHYDYLNDDVDHFLAELAKHLTDFFSETSYKNTMNALIKFPFSKFHYQLVAAQSNTDFFMWRGVVIPIEGTFFQKSNQGLQMANYEKHQRVQTMAFIEELVMTPSLESYQGLFQRLLTVKQWVSRPMIFSDFLSKIKAILNPFLVECVVYECSDMAYLNDAAWVVDILSYLVAYIPSGGTVYALCEKAAIVQSKNPRLIEANDVLEVRLRITGVSKPFSKLVGMVIQQALGGLLVDVSLICHPNEWVWRFYIMIVPDQMQRVVIESEKICAGGEGSKKKTILIIEDNNYNTQTMEMLFQSHGFRTLAAENGQQALQLIESSTNINLIVLDIRMPILDGFGVLNQLKNYSRSPRIPVIILSANITPEINKRLLSYNVSDIFEKPFDSDDLIECINKLLYM